MSSFPISARCRYAVAHHNRCFADCDSFGTFPDDPKQDAEAVGDPFKTLFISRLVSGISSAGYSNTLLQY